MPATLPTHEVLNQSDAAARLQRVRRRPGPARGAGARGRRLGRRPLPRHRRDGGLGGGRRALPPGAAQHPQAPHARPLRPPDRPGRVRLGLPLDAPAGHRPRPALAPVARPAAGRARRAGGDVPHLQRLDTGPACPISINYAAVPTLRQDARPGAEWEERADAPRLRRLRAGRHGDDGEAGRLGPAREHHGRRAGGRRLVRADRPQVVLHPSGLRLLLHARAHRAGPTCFVAERGDRASRSSG